ncbi:hypothetical protein Lal_00000902, partial [Lupinus albus]
LLRDFDSVSGDDEAQELQNELVENNIESSHLKGKFSIMMKFLYNFYYLFANSCGFSIRQCQTYKHSKNDVEGIYKREYICHRIAKQKKKKTKETKKFKINSYNHTLLDKKEVHFLHDYRDIPINDQCHILLSKVGCSVSIIMRVLELDKGIEVGHLPFLEKDNQNFLQYHSNVGKDNDASEVLKL